MDLPNLLPIPELYWYKATVARDWSDGDSVTVDVDFGMDMNRKKIKLRLARIDAFGNKHPKKQEAIELLKAIMPLGREFYLKTIKDKTEKWGRYLAEVFIQADDLPGLMNLNDILVKQGLALYWDGQGEHPTGETVRG